MLKNSSVKRNISTSLMKGCNMKKTYSVAMMGVAASLLLTHGAYGSIIVPPLGGPFTTSSIVSTPNPGVEGTGSGNTLTFVEDVTVLLPTNWGALFDISHTGPNNTTEYLVTKTVTNDTGKQWSNFFFLQGGGYIFDYTNPPTITGSLSIPNPLQMDAGGFHWTGLTVPNTHSITVSFYIDVCDVCSGSTAILQQATVPEPAVLVLTGGGLVSLGLWRRRRTRGRRLSV
jgi:hypothetical protein